MNVYRCLLGTLEMEPQHVCQITMACAVLHNIARRAKLPMPEEVVENGDEDDLHNHQHNQDDLGRGVARRNLIINYFT